MTSYREVWVRLQPGLVGAGAVDGRHLAARYAQVDGELSAMMDVVHQDHPDKVLLSDLSQRFGCDKELDGSRQLLLGNTAHHLGEALLFPVEHFHDGSHGFRRGWWSGKRNRPVEPLGEGLAHHCVSPG